MLIYLFFQNDMFYDYIFHVKSRTCVFVQPGVSSIILLYISPDCLWSNCAHKSRLLLLPDGICITIRFNDPPNCN